MPKRKQAPPVAVGDQPSPIRRHPRNDSDSPVVIDPNDGIFEWAGKLTIEELLEMFPPKSKGK
jgi:hypothetical protein